MKHRKTLWSIIIIVAVTALCGCTTTEYVPIRTMQTERIGSNVDSLIHIIGALTEKALQSENTTDSLMRNHDSTVTVNDRGDTIRIKETEYVYISANRERALERIIETKSDSIRELKQRLISVRVDSIPVPYPVEKKLTRWQQIKMDFGGGAIAMCAIAIIGIAVGLARKLYKASL